MSDLIPVSERAEGLTVLGEVSPCQGPVPCVLEMGHGGDHQLPKRTSLTAEDLDLLAGVRRLREERDELLRCLKNSDLMLMLLQSRDALEENARQQTRAQNATAIHKASR